MLRCHPTRKSFNRLRVPGFEDGVRLARLRPEVATLWTDGGDVVVLAGHRGHLRTVRTFSCAHIVGSLRAAIPLAGHRAALFPTLEPELLLCRSPLELFLEVPGQLVPRRQQRVVTGCGMDVRPRHREVRENAISGRGSRCCSNTTRAVEMGISPRSAFKLSSMSKSSPPQFCIPRSRT